MKLVELLYKFFNSISEYFQSRLKSNEVAAIAEKSEIPEEEYIPKETVEVVVKDEVSLAKRTLKTKLYALEQEIEVFKKEFPHEYCYYLDKIEEMRETYNSDLEKIREQMTFEIDPEFNSKMNGDIIKLEKEIKRFIESEVKFETISKKLQMLIVKVNILYNVSIWHPDEKGKVISQIIKAISTELEIAKEFKECDYILEDNQLRERIVTLISYADYTNFKTSLRNSDITPQQMVEKLVLFTQFKDFDYIATFKSFIEDELSDLGDLLHLINQEEYRRFFENKITNLLKEIAYTTDLEENLLDSAFWSKVFEIESSLFEFLKSSENIEEDKIKVKLIDRIKIDVKESEAVTSPKSNAYLALTSVFSTTRDERIMLLVKLFKNVSNEVTYKEIYFLLQLFDAIEVIETTPNSLNRHMEKYITKYPYDRETLNTKKRYVLNSSAEKQYIKAFYLDEDADKIIVALGKLNIDFKITSNEIVINSFYFKGLENVFSNKQNITNYGGTQNE